MFCKRDKVGNRRCFRQWASRVNLSLMLLTSRQQKAQAVALAANRDCAPGNPSILETPQ